MTDTPLLEADDVQVVYGGVVALDGVSLTVPSVSIVGLIGPNGAGKSTLFGVLSGLVRPARGRVRVDGVDVTRRSPQRRARLGLSRTFQRVELFRELTVRQHVVVARRTRVGGTRLASDLLGFGDRPQAGEVEEVTEIIDLVGLASVAERPAGVLPLGTARLVELARALAGRPRVVLLDEPSSGLDVEETRQLGDVLGRLPAERGLALVLVEHNVDLVLGLVDRVTVLDFGQVIAEGAPADVRADPTVQAAYLGAST